ncbi:MULTISPECIES: response regulator transcription factor [Streptomyces]|uniref:Helix-turn-helix transcriptional regulator n=1 Tax=Streptomyces caniscabiei TaxID=2746961 RepID=A0ABU4N556_9ACTN|nr:MULTISPECIES: helix-turn-helix transcriptional regulator [Streptomyces]MBE4741382.1 helix-turn-helix transcriptional regulator [Streptomyces caniscabiei]MBE4761465.1 helix-turn-helix transcriptional regulator [Streptomyces caniscabiei]MBE4775461.1 helix-turn-helix transcriptional regulator [Streptomyces caniscabiei]MBE4789866.1 helix-turn-helix transcriptional regulator [Streptomyces caniscabiei]MBE4799114.1 helix-turn-helix transcriptional regulator [Streptomyces caniscabiei]
MALDSSGRLSAREMEILLLAAHGMSDADMSRQLSISVRTVASHMRSIREKLCAKNRTHLVVTALRAGILALRTDRMDRGDRTDRADRTDRIDRMDETFRLTGRSGVRAQTVGVA